MFQIQRGGIGLVGGKIRRTLWVCGFWLWGTMGCTMKDNPSEVVYDAVLARRLGCDDYGMSRYTMVFLKRAHARTDSAQDAPLKQKHLQYVARLMQTGKLLVAGPFLESKEWYGVFVLNVESTQEAHQILATDPAVRAGFLTYELHPWYGSAALKDVPIIHKRIEKKGIATPK